MSIVFSEADIVIALPHEKVAMKYFGDLQSPKVLLREYTSTNLFVIEVIGNSLDISSKASRTLHLLPGYFYIN